MCVLSLYIPYFPTHILIFNLWRLISHLDCVIQLSNNGYPKPNMDIHKCNNGGLKDRIWVCTFKSPPFPLTVMTEIRLLTCSVAKDVKSQIIDIPTVLFKMINEKRCFICHSVLDIWNSYISRSEWQIKHLFFIIFISWWDIKHCPQLICWTHVLVSIRLTELAQPVHNVEMTSLRRWIDVCVINDV